MVIKIKPVISNSDTCDVGSQVVSHIWMSVSHIRNNHVAANIIWFIYSKWAWMWIWTPAPRYFLNGPKGDSQEEKIIRYGIHRIEGAGRIVRDFPVAPIIAKRKGLCKSVYSVKGQKSAKLCWMLQSLLQDQQEGFNYRSISLNPGIIELRCERAT